MRGRKAGAAPRLSDRIAAGDFDGMYAVDENGCWEWQYSCNERGYGVVNVDGTPRRAHRLFFEANVCPIPGGLMVLHACDNRRCVNPGHLMLGTAAANMRDAITKGRNSRGVEHPSAKLTDADVEDIRRLYAEGMLQREIGKRYGIHQVTVSRLIRGRTWKHVAA